MPSWLQQSANGKNGKVSHDCLWIQINRNSDTWTTKRILQSIKSTLPSVNLVRLSFIYYTIIMNTIELLKTLRIRDKEIAKTLWVQVAQLNRRQNKLQQPSEESKTQLKNYARVLINHLQLLIFEEEWTIPTNIPTETTTDDSEQELHDTKPLSEDIQEEQLTVKPATKTKKK
jgi:hypothetical protein